MKITFKYIAILFGISFLSIAIFYFMNLNNRRAVETQTLALAVSEGKTIEKVMGKAAVYLLEKGESDLIRFMNEIFDNDQVIYIALGRSGRLIHAATKFEGYLPIETDSQSVRTFTSPLGEIIEVTASMRDRFGNAYKVHIGYFIAAIGEIHNAAKKNFLLLTLMQAAIVLLLIAFLFRFNRQMSRKELEVQREKEKREKLQEISLITAGINHEIRNPLNSLYLSYQMLEPLLDHANQEAVFHSNSIKREIKRIQQIIERFSTLSQAISVRREEIDLQQFFKDMQPVWAGMARRPEIINRHEPEMKITSDRSLLTQIIANVVNNAAEAGASRIDIVVAAQKDKTVFSIKDNGPGISKEHVKYVFDPFVTFKAKGSGIGLALTKKMVLQLGGRIEVESAEGRGAEFRIFL
ncbi:MAG: HAMP domain-containing histidine kinase [Chrysiogenales bacterium]|nr:MAG: HAMP domain-containing histidine kinase [Chrysiogenales bacterium]